MKKYYKKVILIFISKKTKVSDMERMAGKMKFCIEMWWVSLNKYFENIFWHLMGTLKNFRDRRDGFTTEIPYANENDRKLTWFPNSF